MTQSARTNRILYELSNRRECEFVVRKPFAKKLQELAFSLVPPLSSQRIVVVVGVVVVVVEVVDAAAETVERNK